MAEMSEDRAREMTDAILEGRKLLAIKIYKGAADVDLRTAKEFVEDLTRQLWEECPERFATATAPVELSAEEEEAVYADLFAGNKIQAIKRYKMAIGVDLREAKEYIDELETYLRVEWPEQFGAGGSGAGSAGARDILPENVARDIATDLFAGRKIEAIKRHRAATGKGLKASKEVVDDLERQLRQESPEKFSTPARSGCGAVVLLGGVAGLASWLLA